MNFENIEFNKDNIVIKNAKDFNIKQTFECGQCFRWKKVGESYIGVAFNRVIEVEQKEDDVIIYNSNEEDFNNIWRKYFDLNRDYTSIKEKLSKDELLKKAVDFGYGIRLLNQDPFELVISFIISARNSIPVISKTINKISEKWGDAIEYKGERYYTFPTVEQLKEATEEDIRSTGASFRSRYIYDTVQKIYNCNVGNEEFKLYNLENIKKLSDDECHEELQNFSGVGAKVADCIMLFSMEKYSAFPVDVWVKRAMQHFYLAPDVSLNKIRVFAREKFGELSGFAQQYLFYYARENSIKID
ncbi:DNA-3-methyladenine glycosylase family protein [Inconstantimicrobium mannanitabidum]|uniref:8-oxoguanine DNA glycosylase n=1 Tax=Inconstantimicrobium mannanitabidum TaxID=1604901 RepID=A0ACB5R6H1_9CLOT|nr:DNA-3-methyladenine glycosylase [Clostridium sp. TW13]GKX64830.1 8-oxoguanine DNA glycosylase [Clostridium sp. TW13]